MDPQLAGNKSRENHIAQTGKQYKANSARHKTTRLLKTLREILLVTVNERVSTLAQQPFCM